ncbi:MAG: FAD-dependent oxidoreductase [Leptospirales bacterium]|nr:FAD-dependent oxidoreductase [Leptospirales bacterium]
MNEKSSNVLVVGSGIAGIRASFELAEKDFNVYLCESASTIGGALFSMERWFPDDACGMCRSLPFFAGCTPAAFCLRRGITHPNIKTFTSAKIASVTGDAGNFSVSIENKAVMIAPEKCTACGLCAGVCPISVPVSPASFLGTGKAARISNPLALRKVYNIDENACNKCGECLKVCPVNAINLNPSPSFTELDAGAVIIATGFDILDPTSASHYGYGRYPNVVTNLELEYMLTGYGSSDGRLIRPSDQKVPQSVAFIQCVGSREADNGYCSSTCCTFAIKEAQMIREHINNTRVKIFYMDMRPFGRHCEEYYQNAKQSGIFFVRGRPPAIRQNFANNDLILSFMDDKGAVSTETFDMVVLSVAQKPSSDFASLAQALGIELNHYGFVETSSMPTHSSRDGIFVCGLASGPKDISETVSEACAAAASAMRCLQTRREERQHKLLADDEKTAFVICNCNGLLSFAGELASYAGSIPGINDVIEVPYLCGKEGALADLLENRSRAILAACSIFSGTPELYPARLEFVNIREEAAWVHSAEEALQKSKTAIAMAASSLSFESINEKPLQTHENSALVIGAGVSGMEAAISLSKMGIEVDIIEKTEKTGGLAADICFTIEKTDIPAYIDDLRRSLLDNPLIRLYTSTDLASIQGFPGNFKCTVKNAETESEINCGAVILATGASRHISNAYPASPFIITQRQLEQRLADNETPKGPVIMLQCVGARNDEHKYCGRLCCTQAVKNAIKIKEQYPETAVSVIYKDIRVYGFNEDYYALAREIGVIFHPIDEEAEVSLNDDMPLVKFKDAILDAVFEYKAGLLILSVPLVPSEDAVILAGLTGAELAEDGFFCEADAKFSPFDSVREGIVICGSASGPKSVWESATQARAAASRAATILQKENLSTGRELAIVNERRCSGCAQCVSSCRYGARYRGAETGKILVRDLLCQGCGSCSAICPNNASSQIGFTSAQAFALIETALLKR